MPTTPKIKKERILEAALQMVIDEGKNSINIKSLAAYLGCSTQPISWHFGGMEQLRQELSKAAISFIWQKLSDIFESSNHILERCSKTLVDLAFDMPNLMEFFIYDDYCKQKALLSCEYEHNPRVHKMIECVSSDVKLEIEDAKDYVLNMYIFTVGLIQMVISNNFKGDKQLAHKLLINAGSNNLKALGVDISVCPFTEF